MLVPTGWPYIAAAPQVGYVNKRPLDEGEKKEKKG